MIPTRKIDVITANLPWIDETANDIVEASQWDTAFRTNSDFFSKAINFLKPGGRIYMSSGNYAEIRKFYQLAKVNCFKIKLIGSKYYTKNINLQFYAFELQPNSEN